MEVIVFHTPKCGLVSHPVGEEAYSNCWSVFLFYPFFSSVCLTCKISDCFHFSAKPSFLPLMRQVEEAEKEPTSRSQVKPNCQPSTAMLHFGLRPFSAACDADSADRSGVAAVFAFAISRFDFGWIWIAALPFEEVLFSLLSYTSQFTVRTCRGPWMIEAGNSAVLRLWLSRDK